MQDIIAKELTKRYGEVLAVDQVSFSVEQKMIFGFLGPNGAGKSTTLLMLTGVTRPDAGSVEIAGYDLNRQPLKAKEVMGVVPEMANVYVDISAWENLMFMGDVYGVNKKIKINRAAELLKQFDLYEKRHLKTKGFSKGMKQRLLLCMAFISDPRVLFLDEPTSGLDVHSTRIIRKVIQEFNHSGKTIIVTTHNIEEASQLCNKIAIINQGRIAAIDRPENLKNTFSQMQSVAAAFQPQSLPQEVSEELGKTSQVRKEGDHYIFYTEDPGEFIFEVTRLCADYNIKILSLETQGPSLEDVFLKITGQFCE